MMHRKVSQLVVSENDEEGRSVLSTCSSAVLAAQIKKVMPTKYFDNRRSSIALGLERINSALQQKKSRVLMRESISPSVHFPEMDELLVPETKDEAVDPELIKTIPVPLPEKRLFRETFTLPPGKLPWSDKVIENVKYNYKDLSSKFELWNKTLKKIEGYFGAGIVSYFLFLRWLLLMNCIILLLNFIFLVVPQIAFTPVKQHFNVTVSSNFSLIIETLETEDQSKISYEEIYKLQDNNETIVDITVYCRKIYVEEINTARKSDITSSVQNFLQGTGWMEPTLLFLGSYPREHKSFFGLTYEIPLAFIAVFMTSYLICFIMIMLYSSYGIKESLMNQVDLTYQFANEVFSAWDYCIQDNRTAALHQKMFINGLKSTLSEIQHKKEAKKRSSFTWAKLYLIRFVVNALVFAWVIGCYWLINKLVILQLEAQKQPYEQGFKTFAVEYLPPFSVTLIGLISPYVFYFLVSFEKYHTRTEINLSLARNVFMGLSSLLVLVASFHRQITCKSRDICGRGNTVDCSRPMCWETYVGQELYKLYIIEFFTAIGIFLLHDIPRGIICEKYDNKFTRLIGRAVFYLPTEVLSLIYLQTICWLGVFYSPLLPVMLVLMLIFLFYIKKAVVVRYAAPLDTPYKTSRFNSTFITSLVISFLAVLVVHFYTLTQVRPSLGCGPFSQYRTIVDALHEAQKKIPYFLPFWEVLFSAWFYVPAYAMLCFLIYYYWRRSGVLKLMERKLTDELIVLGKDRQYLLEKIQELEKKGE